MAKMNKKIVAKELTERGKWLFERTAASQNVNADNQNSINIDGQQCRIGQKCPVCSFKIRGTNHVTGSHHKGCVARHKGR